MQVVLSSPLKTSLDDLGEEESSLSTSSFLWVIMLLDLFAPLYFDDRYGAYVCELVFLPSPPLPSLPLICSSVIDLDGLSLFPIACLAFPLCCPIFSSAVDLFDHPRFFLRTFFFSHFCRSFWSASVFFHFFFFPPFDNARQ